MYKKYFKRPFDFIISLIAIILLSPIMLIVAILVRIKLGSPIIFCQERPGKDEKIFRMYKFRTMTDEKDDRGDFLADEIRLTMFGKLLRSTSLDELPELFNILKGDMSIVGPRPLLVEYLNYYTDIEKQRHTVRPGLTVPQVLDKDTILTWDNQLKSDIEYVKNINFLLDIKIILHTFEKLFRRNKEEYGSYIRKKLSEERKESTDV